MSKIFRSRTIAVLATAVVVVIGLEMPTWGSRPAAKKIGTAQLKNHAVTTHKLANGSVTSSKVRDGSLTASDVAPNTFLPAGGTAADSDKLGGRAASGYVQGTGGMLSNQVSVGPNSTGTILDLDWSKITGSCSASPGSHPTLNFLALQSPINLVTTITTFAASGARTDITTLNGLNTGDSAPGTNTSGVPQTATFQVRYVDGSDTAHIVTAWLSGQDVGGTCLFIGQALTTD